MRTFLFLFLGFDQHCYPIVAIFCRDLLRGYAHLERWIASAFIDMYNEHGNGVFMGKFETWRTTPRPARGAYFAAKGCLGTPVKQGSRPGCLRTILDVI